MTIQVIVHPVYAQCKRRNVCNVCGVGNFFTIMVDDATDVANISQLTLCIHWVDDNLYYHEDFIRLLSLDVANAEEVIVAVIKDVILQMNFNLKNCRGQCYNGCSAMKEESK